MAMTILANGEILPETFEFLRVGWWIVHLVGIPVVGFVGYMIGKGKGGKSAPPAQGS